MLEHKKIQDLNDYFADLNVRKEKCVYFYRINGYSSEINEFIKKYYDVARRTGVVIEGKLANPDDKNLAYYSEIMGMDFQMNVNFFNASLKKWLPRMNDFQRKNVADSIYDALMQMHRNGKNENMCKNAYIKFMCWLYYKFERIVNQLGENNVPKILYEGEVSTYELMLISILSNAGCDVVFLQYKGDQNYLKVDPDSTFSFAYEGTNLESFPDGFSIKVIREELQNAIQNERLYGEKPKFDNCTNAWASAQPLLDIKESTVLRGKDPAFYYNCFYRIVGVENKVVYVNELYRMYQDLKNAKRKIVVVDNEIPKPTNEEISSITRGTYQRFDQLVMGLVPNIQCPQSTDLKAILKKAFIDVLIEENKREQNLSRLTSKAVYLLCWLKRYQGQLFGSWKMPEVGCFIYMGGCKNENEALFIKLLSKLPTDVLILCPNLNVKCCLEDHFLLEKKYNESMNVEKFPQENANLHIGTAAFHAERELDTIMYQDSGMYRDKQYSQANVVSLQTMYEEIAILWDEEIKYRPNFSTNDGVVSIPVIFAKVSGVKNGNLDEYWQSVKKCAKSADTTFVSSVPFIPQGAPNSMKAYSTDFFKNGKIIKNKVKNCQEYKYGILREEMQDFMLDKLQVLINDKLIKGIGENGMEYTVIATVLNLPKEIVRQIQKFDFTKKNPKFVYLNTTEAMVSLEDAIIMAYLNLIGFDVVFFSPTGYQSFEKYYNKKIMEEHQIGDYVYDLQVPNFDNINSAGTVKVKGLKSIFKKKH